MKTEITTCFLLAASLSLVVQTSTANEEENKQEAGDEGPIRLESIFVGDKEQPAISYFIPWQGVGAPDELHWNEEKKHDEALEPVDREVMMRSMELYEQAEMEAPSSR